MAFVVARPTQAFPASGCRVLAAILARAPACVGVCACAGRERLPGADSASLPTWRREARKASRGFEGKEGDCRLLYDAQSHGHRGTPTFPITPIPWPRVPEASRSAGHVHSGSSKSWSLGCTGGFCSGNMEAVSSRSVEPSRRTALAGLWTQAHSCPGSQCSGETTRDPQAGQVPGQAPSPAGLFGKVRRTDGACS